MRSATFLRCSRIIRVIWTMLIAIHSVMIIVISLTGARDSDGAFGAYALAIPVALVLLISNWLAWMKLPDVFIRRLQDHPQSRREKVLSVLYGAAAVWAFVGAGLVHWIVRQLLQLVF